MRPKETPPDPAQRKADLSAALRNLALEFLSLCEQFYRERECNSRVNNPPPDEGMHGFEPEAGRPPVSRFHSAAPWFFAQAEW